MKIFFWLLVAVNVILFAVMKSGVLEDAQPAQTLLPLHEEKISLINGQKSAASAPVASEVAPASAALAVSAVVPAISAVLALPASAPAVAVKPGCFEWGEFSGADIDKAAKNLKALQLGDRLSQRETSHATGYWVYIAPLKDKAAVNEKLAQLKSRGVTDYFVVQDAGEWLNAISLGVFKTRESAQNFLDGLRSKDIRTAQLGEKSSKSHTVVFVMNGLDAQTSDKLTVLQKNFATSELKRVVCH
jgi:cell division septation protein DedD